MACERANEGERANKPEMCGGGRICVYVRAYNVCMYISNQQCPEAAVRRACSLHFRACGARRSTAATEVLPLGLRGRGTRCQSSARADFHPELRVVAPPWPSAVPRNLLLDLISGSSFLWNVFESTGHKTETCTSVFAVLSWHQ